MRPSSGRFFFVLKHSLQRLSGLHAGLPIYSLPAVTISVVPLPFFHILFPGTPDHKTAL
jgi:hypothetical protein